MRFLKYSPRRSVGKEVRMHEHGNPMHFLRVDPVAAKSFLDAGESA